MSVDAYRAIMRYAPHISDQQSEEFTHDFWSLVPVLRFAQERLSAPSSSLTAIPARSTGAGVCRPAMGSSMGHWALGMSEKSRQSR